MPVFAQSRNVRHALPNPVHHIFRSGRPHKHVRHLFWGLRGLPERVLRWLEPRLNKPVVSTNGLIILDLMEPLILT